MSAAAATAHRIEDPFQSGCADGTFYFQCVSNVALQFGASAYIDDACTVRQQGRGRTASDEALPSIAASRRNNYEVGRQSRER
jgi:hypothetical protein